MRLMIHAKESMLRCQEITRYHYREIRGTTCKPCSLGLVRLCYMVCPWQWRCIVDLPPQQMTRFLSNSYPVTAFGGPTPWDGGTFTLVGDLVNGLFNVAQMSSNLTKLVTLTTVLNDGAMINEITTNPNGLVSHKLPNDPNTEEVRTRQATWVPFALT